MASAPGPPSSQRKLGAAALSVLSNSALILANVVARTVTSLESAHRTAHELQDRISARLAGADVLIHLEPEDRVRPGEVLSSGEVDGR
jgi:divalent metal cation (Fe/Co/Zn/Cd) transporter